MKTFGNTIVGCALLGLLMLFAGCETDSRVNTDYSPTTTIKAASLPPEFMEFRVGDKVMINFSGHISPPPSHIETVKEDGTITLPLVGPTDAKGLTAKELEEAIHSMYVPDYFKRLTVTIQAEERFFWVGGEVRKPGMLPYAGETTVLKCITAAGDFTDFADEKKVMLTRVNGKIYTINCKEAQRRPKLDLAVYPGDRIEVRRRLF
ncbi:polysaccharide biosynthesis/export family protein [Verrucomicrobia bacterium]|nr:polysaccharide biosynthesis/export family protein [Verrucomicrobiota bacterium]MDB4459160.1 polysaccharide biosynthesis/export family protein [bacterium]